MSRTEKLIAFLLGALVFAGLFFFIYTSLRTPPAAPPLGDAAGVAADEEEPFDFNVGADTAAATSVAPDDKETPVPAELPPAPAKTGKK